MMVWVAAIALVVLFALGLKGFKVISSSRQVISLSKTVMSTLQDKSMTDLEKEKVMQKYSLEFFKFFLIILLGCAAAVGIPLALIWLADLMGWVSLQAVLDLTLSIPFLVLTTVLATFAVWLMKKRG